MSQFSVWFTNLVLIVSVYTSAGDLTECKQNDMACVEKNANTLYQMIMSGDPERHIAPHEPLHHGLIEGNLSILKYKFFNSTFVGMNTCKISNLNWNVQTSFIRLDVTCGNITMTGKYEIDGRLIILPIKGEGDYKIDTHGYKISVECEIDEIDESDGNKHLHIHTYRLKETPTAPIVFALDNLFNGQKEMYTPSPLHSVEIDDDDLTESTNTRELRKCFASIVRCGMDLSEPINVDHIRSSLIGFKYTLDDVTLKNFSTCALRSSSINLDSKDINMYLDCPLLTLLAKYNVSGILIALPLEGQGDVSVVFHDYGISLVGKLQEFIGKDGQQHVKVKNFTPTSYFGGPVVYSLTNLFYGNEFLSKEAHNYINSNWKPVSEFVQGPAVYAVIKQLFKNINKCLKPVSVANIES